MNGHPMLSSSNFSFRSMKRPESLSNRDLPIRGEKFPNTDFAIFELGYEFASSECSVKWPEFSVCWSLSGRLFVQKGF